MSGHQIMMGPTLLNLLESGHQKVQSLRWVSSLILGVHCEITNTN